MFSLPGNLSPEQTLLQEENIAEATNLIDGLQDAFERAKVHGLGYEGSKAAKRIFEVLPHEAGLEKELLADRLMIAWLNRNNEEARQLVASITDSLPLRQQ